MPPAEKPSWVSKIPNWWPVAIGLLFLIVAGVEARYVLYQHVGEEAKQDAVREELQSKGITNAHTRVTKLEQWKDGLADRLSDRTFQDWVADRARKEAEIQALKEDNENLQARVTALERALRP